MTIEEIRWLVEYYNARWKWEFPQEIQNYKTLIAEINRLRMRLGEMTLREGDTVEQFDKECKDEVVEISEDRQLFEMATAWYARALKHKYTYHFKWLGVPFIQMPQDLVAIQEVLFEQKPDLVIEAGVARGGGILFYASILDMIGHGRVVGIEKDLRQHAFDAITQSPLLERVHDVVEGSSTDPDVVAAIMEMATDKRVVTILDSDHTHEHVHAELAAYAPISSYIIVLDTIIEFLPADSFPDKPWGPGNSPYTAVREFLKGNPAYGKSFEVDTLRGGKLVLTTAPSGYLKRKEV